MINEDEEAMPASESYHRMPERAPYDSVPDGAKALSRLVNALDDAEFNRFWSALGDAIRLSALAVHRYSQS